MKTYRYVGPHAAVEVPSLGAVVKKDDTVTVANDLAEGFEGQEVWALVPDPTPAVKKTAQTKDED